MSRMAALDQTRKENRIEVGGIIFVVEFFDAVMKIERYASWDDFFDEHPFPAEQQADVSAHAYTSVGLPGGNFAPLVRARHIIALDSDGKPIDPEPALRAFVR